MTDGNGPVAGLQAADFRVLDNGVAQRVRVVPLSALPVDVTLVLDTSASLDAAAFAQLKADVQEIANALTPADRIRFLTFATHVSDAFGLRPGDSELPVDRLTTGGATSFYDALATAFLVQPGADRPELIFALSDGGDNTSFIAPATLLALASRTGAALYVGLLPPPATRPFTPIGRDSVGSVFVHRSSLTPFDARPDVGLLRDVTAQTGGDLVRDVTGDRLPVIFKRVLEDLPVGLPALLHPGGRRRARLAQSDGHRHATRRPQRTRAQGLRRPVVALRTATVYGLMRACWHGPHRGDCRTSMERCP